MDRICNGPGNDDGHDNGYVRPRLLRLNGNLVASTTIAAAQRRLGGYDHGNGYDHDCGGSTTTAITTLTMVTIAVTWWLRPRLRQLGGYNHGNGYDLDCCGSTTTAITTLAMVTIAAAMATIAEPMSVLDRPPSPHRELY